MSVVIFTNEGELVINLYTDECPLTCTNFLKLCKIGYYDGCLIHSVNDFIAKTGDPTRTWTGGDSIYKFLHGDHARFFNDEIQPELNHSKTGTVGMDSFGPNLNASQFYITLRDDLHYLDGQHTVFGEIISGFDTLTAIANAPVDCDNRPCDDIVIRETYVTEDPFDDPPQLAQMIRDKELGPQQLDPDTLLYICGLNYVTDDERLYTISSRFGTVIWARVLRDSETGDSLGCALIQFESKVASKEARFEMDNAVIDGRRIRVDYEEWFRRTSHYPAKRGTGPYSVRINKVEKEIDELAKKINDLCVIKEFDTDSGLAPPSQWDLVSDEQKIDEEQPLRVATCTEIISPGTEDAKYVIDIKKIGKFVVGLGDIVSPTDIDKGMRVGVDRKNYQIQIPLPPRIDPLVTMMIVEEKPDVTYSDIGGCKEQIEKIREVVELTLLHPEKFVRLGNDPPKGILFYGPPGTGKTLVARAVANRTGACFIRIIGTELVQKNIGEGARMVCELFQMARSKKACILFFDEIDAIGGARFDDGVGGDNEVQRTMLEIMNQLDGFDARSNVKVLMATNRRDILDPALLRLGRLDREVEFCLPDLEGRTEIFKIHTRTMNCERDIRFEFLALFCPNTTGADIRSICTGAGMSAIGAGRKVVTEKDFLVAVKKVVKGYTPHYI